jgi:predicted MFS family arabinose efflux permease
MAIGSVVMGAGLLGLAISYGVITYMLAWAILGIATPMALTQTAMPGLVQVVGPSARRAITGLTLINGLSSTFMLPLMEAMLSGWGWRNTFVGLAALNVFVCLPLHLIVLSRGPPTRPTGEAGSGRSWEGVLPESWRPRALILIAIWSCMEGLVTWGLYMQAIDLFSAQGIPRATAIAIWMLVGPMQALARFVDLILGNRFSINSVSLVSAVLVMASFAVLLPFGVSAASATCFAFVIGTGHGLFAIARNMLPLTLFGQREYGAYMGRLMLPQNISNAGAPVAFAAIITQFGPATALWLTWVSSTIALVSVILLTRYCRAATAAEVSVPRPT